jgi:copper chaperone CopZ
MIRYFTAVVLAALLSFTALAQDAPRAIEMRVDGLVCAFCAQGISKKLGKMHATQEVLVNLEKGLVAVALKPGQEISDATLREVLTEAGYTVQGIERRAETLDQVRARLKAVP